MTPENETITVNKQELIDAILELERQEAYRHFELESYIESLETLADKLRDFLTFSPESKAKARVQKLFMPLREWGKVISDELLEQWENEWKAALEKESPASAHSTSTIQ